eukprot:TRINITY_DN1974_c0_g1_i1.p1 TRINITY_DN1974_c0_g1~~TRINITY_DN1974_c0_g1_i1.p1  ORF type:complete len:330 (-),score=87.32 TRINITY_DN1974_c0_g1_i1:64-1053(-)
MKFVIAVLAIFGVARAAIELSADFEVFASKFNKVYTSPMERLIRYNIFSSNLKKIAELNSAADRTWTAGVNQFADLTWDEFKATVGLMAPQDCSATHPRSDSKTFLNVGDVPASVDWRTKGVITAVKDQGQCGSCWTFSTTGCLEAHHALKTGQLVSLSEQQLVDCAQAFNNNGCDGGLPSQAFEYVRYNGGLDTEASYGYTGTDGTCHYSASSVGATVKDVYNVTFQDENELVQVVATTGPVSIAYEVTTAFQFYTSGVFSDSSCSKDPQSVNHAVLAVGYDVDSASGKPYWIVKNSWGASWGIDGYFWILRGENECGLADCASYPIV